MGRINIVCVQCGSNDVRRDADARWDTENQEWELAGVYDQGYCEQCGGNASLKEVPFDTLAEREELTKPHNLRSDDSIR